MAAEPQLALHLAPADASLAHVAREAAGCRRCPLWQTATQLVFGEGPPDAAVMLIGEQPGDQEDLAGRPFVGPAGRLLDQALAEAGIDRGTVYVTNAVKHFKFVPRGKRRIHQNPSAGEIEACRWWLTRERGLVRPRFLVLLGATAARAVLGRSVTISRSRGQPMAVDDAATAIVTVHPSYLLRLPDAEAKTREYAAFVADLRTVRSLVESG
jgi:DNA polymerase